MLRQGQVSHANVFIVESALKCIRAYLNGNSFIFAQIQWICLGWHVLNRRRLLLYYKPCIMNFDSLWFKYVVMCVRVFLQCVHVYSNGCCVRNIENSVCMYVRIWPHGNKHPKHVETHSYINDLFDTAGFKF